MPMVRMRPGVVQRNHQRGCAGVGRRPRRKWFGRRVRQLHSHVCADLIFSCSSGFCPDLLQLYKRILRVIRVTCGHSTAHRFVGVFPKLNACVATVTAGWCPTAARRTGAGTARRDCCFARPRPDGIAAVLLQHRAPWSHQGGTWALPGGARDSHETPEEAAVREAHEEAGLAAEQAGRADDRGHGGGARRASGPHWTYTTVIADAPEPARDRAQPGEFRTALGGRGRGRDAAAAPGVRGELAELRAVAAAIPLCPRQRCRSRAPRHADRRRR